jgi:hypothetical protein
VVLQSPSELEFVYSPWPDRYADAVPRSFKQEDVYRLNAVLARAAAVAGTEQKVLIGGWLLEAKTSGCSDRRYEPWCTGMRWLMARPGLMTVLRSTTCRWRMSVLWSSPPA